MIQSRQELHEVLNMDARAMGIRRYSIKNLLWRDVWQYIKILRLYEYSVNCNVPMIVEKVLKYLHYKKGIKLGFDIPPNTCGGGLRINHFGLIVISSQAKIGKWCDIHQGVNIGTGYDGAPIIGDNVWIGPGVKIFGNIEIADRCAIGAGAVVNKSFHTKGISIAGVPAMKVSEKGNIYIRE